MIIGVRHYNHHRVEDLAFRGKVMTMYESSSLIMNKSWEPPCAFYVRILSCASLTGNDFSSSIEECTFHVRYSMLEEND
jgi:hypothetical protein